MRLRMKVKVLGTRNGIEWPDAGKYVNVPDDEAENLIKHGHAEKAEEKQPEK